MYYLGYDLGSSSVKIALVEKATGKQVKVIQEPQQEMEISALKSDWAEQDPMLWWEQVCIGTKRIISETQIASSKIEGIGISYQMHGLVVVDKEGNPLRDAIIWCDSRAVAIGEEAFQKIGEEKCMQHLLNSPGNFTASKLKWVKENEPDIYASIHKFMLPGDFIAYKLSNKLCTTSNGLSEGILWDYELGKPADFLLDHYGISSDLIPEIVQNFTHQGNVSSEGAQATGLVTGIPIVYRAGDQPNNAMSLNIFNPGEVAATGGTSGVLYAVTDSNKSNEPVRINHFAHVNYSVLKPTIGKLLCINGAGIQYRWVKDLLGDVSYETMNKEASNVAVGANGLQVIPFGNGAERMLSNTNLGTQICNLNLNQHSRAHLCRAALEGIAFSFVYGMELLKNDRAKIEVIRAGNDNLFRSELFSNTVATLIGHEIEIYNTTGAVGAARAVSLLDGDIEKFGDQISKHDHVHTYYPLEETAELQEAYTAWKSTLEHLLKNK